MVKMKKLLYGIKDKVPFPSILIYAIQQLLAVITATALIANICGTPISSCLFGAFVGTLTYQIITKWQSPMFISSCGATCSAVIGALAIGGGKPNYRAVMFGGFVIFLVYFIVARFVAHKGAEGLNSIFPPTIVGPVTMVIGLNLAGFIPTYVQVNGNMSTIGVLVAIATMIVIALSSHYLKGFYKTIPFLIGLIFGYFISLILTITNVAPLIDLTVFQNTKILMLPDFAFLHFNDTAPLQLTDYLQTLILFLPVAICACLEHYSDHAVLSNIVNENLLIKPGLSKTLLGDGLASFLGTITCGLPNTSYGESIATTGFSKVASTKVITLAAAIIGTLAFIGPFQAFLISIPSCVFGGCAMILYGYIAASGLKTIFNNQIDLNNNKNLIIISVILTVGVSGIYLFSESFAGVSLSMVLGVILNLILKEKENVHSEND